MPLLPSSSDLQVLDTMMPFRRPSIELYSPFALNERDAIRSFPDLIDFNARYNPDHVFTLQEERENGQLRGFAKITFAKLRQLVGESVTYIQENTVGITSKLAGGIPQKHRAIALFLESDLTLFVYLCALLQMNIPVWSIQFKIRYTLN